MGEYNITRNSDGSIASINGLDFNNALNNTKFSDLRNFFPTVTTASETFNSQALIAALSYATGQDDWDGYVKSDPFYVNPDPGIAQNFNGVGDPRFSLGQAMQNAFNVFIPRQQALIEVKNAGGCQIINEYICDSDGVPIVKASSNCAGLSGNLRIQQNEIIDYVKTSFFNAIQNQSDSFVTYINDNYVAKGYTLNILDFSSLHILSLKLTKPNYETVFFKYFYDQKDYLSKSFGTALTEVGLADNFLQSSTNNPALSSYNTSPLSFIQTITAVPMLF